MFTSQRLRNGIFVCEYEYACASHSLANACMLKLCSLTLCTINSNFPGFEQLTIFIKMTHTTSGGTIRAPTAARNAQNPEKKGCVKSEVQLKELFKESNTRLTCCLPWGAWQFENIS